MILFSPSEGLAGCDINGGRKAGTTRNGGSFPNFFFFFFSKEHRHFVYANLRYCYWEAGKQARIVYSKAMAEYDSLFGVVLKPFLLSLSLLRQRERGKLGRALSKYAGSIRKMQYRNDLHFPGFSLTFVKRVVIIHSHSS